MQTLNYHKDASYCFKGYTVLDDKDKLVYLIINVVNENDNIELVVSRYNETPKIKNYVT